VARPAYPQTSIEARSLGLPAGVEIGTYTGITPTPVSDEERERLRLRVEFLRRL
jgi:hypothetical protein